MTLLYAYMLTNFKTNFHIFLQKHDIFFSGAFKIQQIY